MIFLNFRLLLPSGCWLHYGEGFLAPYRGTRYHLSEWREGCAPINYEEYFNMKHASARNVIECCFGLFKIHWGILRSRSYYPIKTHNRIITACCLIHNLIRRKISTDSIENDLNINKATQNLTEDDIVASIASSDQWTTWRDDLAKQIFDEWRQRHGH